MKKTLMLMLAITMLSPFPSIAEETQTDEEILMSKDDIAAKEWRDQVMKERANETNRFKLKAIKNAEKREKKYEEILERKKEKMSRYQLEDQQKNDKEYINNIKKQNQTSESRFTEKAKLRAEQRKMERELREKRLHRTKKQ